MLLTPVQFWQYWMDGLHHGVTRIIEIGKGVVMDTHLFSEGFVASAANVLLADSSVTNHSYLPGIFQC